MNAFAHGPVFSKSRSLLDPCRGAFVPRKITFLTLCLTALAGSANATNVFAAPAHVTFIDTSGIPGSIHFGTDLTGDAYCQNTSGVRDQFYYIGGGGNAGAENVKATYAGLLAAQLSGRTVVMVYNTDTVYTGTQDPRGCFISFVYLNNS